ncbi:MAG: hypothetical protein ACOYM3_02790 [Terrimicrobiaceae bacterium]
MKIRKCPECGGVRIADALMRPESLGLRPISNHQEGHRHMFSVLALLLYRVVIYFALIAEGLGALHVIDTRMTPFALLLFAFVLSSPLVLAFAIIAAFKGERPVHLWLIALSDGLPGLFVLSMFIWRR